MNVHKGQKLFAIWTFYLLYEAKLLILGKQTQVGRTWKGRLTSIEYENCVWNLQAHIELTATPCRTQDWHLKVKARLECNLLLLLWTTTDRHFEHLYTRFILTDWQEIARSFICTITYLAGLMGLNPRISLLDVLERYEEYVLCAGILEDTNDAKLAHVNKFEHLFSVSKRNLLFCVSNVSTD